jgi:hypothetical protein
MLLRRSRPLDLVGVVSRLLSGRPTPSPVIPASSRARSCAS